MIEYPWILIHFTVQAMAKTYLDVLNQIEVLKQEAERLHAAEVKDVIQRIKGAISIYGLTMSDLGFGGGRAKKVKAPKAATKRIASKAAKSTAGRKVAPKYRDEQGNTWTGRGLKPRWLTAAIANGKKPEDFAI